MPKPMAENKRSFTIDKDSFGYGSGRYIAASPAIAAKHAARQCFRLVKKKPADFGKFAGRDTVFIQLEETTRGSARKTFAYKVTREKKPQTAARAKFLAQRKIKSDYLYHVISVDDAEFKAALGSKSA